MFPAILSYFEGIPDPRTHRTRLHPLSSLLGIALCAVLCGADTWVEIEEYGQAKYEWLSQWLQLPNGIPSHDTFARPEEIFCNKQEHHLLIYPHLIPPRISTEQL